MRQFGSAASAVTPIYITEKSHNGSKREEPFVRVIRLILGSSFLAVGLDTLLLSSLCFASSVYFFFYRK